VHVIKPGIQVSSCIHSCPFMSIDGNVMGCTHPKFDDAELYAGCIISWDNGADGGLPPKCPFRDDAELCVVQSYSAREALEAEKTNGG